jgi:type III secretion protein T
MRDTLLLFLKLFDREFVALILSLPRVYAFMAGSGLLAASAVPRTARVAVVLALALLPAGLNLASVDGFDRQPTSFALVLVRETVIGFVLGYLIGWVLWAVAAAGNLIDNQRGSSMASSIDPLQGHETSLLGIAFSQAFLTFLFVSGAVLPIIGLLYQSYAVWPTLKPLPISLMSQAFPALMLHVFDYAMRFTFVVAGPIVAMMFLAEFALAMVSRFAPQIQVFILAMPIKSIIALFILVFYFTPLLPYATSQSSAFQAYIAQLYGIMNGSQGTDVRP